MRECYHQKCDSVENPDLKVDEGIEFLSLTTQALLLVVANMSGGMFFYTTQYAKKWPKINF